MGSFSLILFCIFPACLPISNDNSFSNLRMVFKRKLIELDNIFFWHFADRIPYSILYLSSLFAASSSTAASSRTPSTVCSSCNISHLPCSQPISAPSVYGTSARMVPGTGVPGNAGGNEVCGYSAACCRRVKSGAGGADARVPKTLQKLFHAFQQPVQPFAPRRRDPYHIPRLPVLWQRVVDASNPEREEQMRVVYQTLKELGCEDTPVITVYLSVY